MKPFIGAAIISIGLISTAFLSGCGTESPPPPPPPISVSISPATAVVEINGAHGFTAMVVNDPSNKGITWSLSGQSCTNVVGECGSLSSTQTNTVTYTAPASVASSATVTLTATSMADNSKSATATVTVTLPISVFVAPGLPSVAPGGVQRFLAPVTNDPSLSGVIWTLSQNGGPCSPACGTISPEVTPGAALTSYTAPASAPDGSLVYITATSVTSPLRSTYGRIIITASGNNNAKLSGRYAFLSTRIGSVAADGRGGLSGFAVLDSEKLPVPVMGAYFIDSKDQGTLTLATDSGDWVGYIGLNGALTSDASPNAGALGLHPVRGAILKKQDSTAFSNSKISGGYAFGFWGESCGQGFCSNAFDIGQFQADGTTGLTRGGSSTGSYIVSDSTTGYGTATIPNKQRSDTYALYVVNETELFFQLDLHSQSAGYGAFLIGRALRQETPSQGFSNESLKGIGVIGETGGKGVVNIGPLPPAIALLGLLNPDGAGNFTLADDKNDTGTITSEALTGTYNVATDGGVTMTGKNLTMYLVSTNQGFVFDEDTNALGFLQPQTATSVVGAFAYGNMLLGTAAEFGAGLATLDSSGNVTLFYPGSLPLSGKPDFPVTFTGTYTIDPDGRGTIYIGTIDTTTLVFCAISPTEFVAIDTFDPDFPYPTLLLFSQ
jgi:hypothetical protein